MGGPFHGSDVILGLKSRGDRGQKKKKEKPSQVGRAYGPSVVEVGEASLEEKRKPPLEMIFSLGDSKTG